jgi:hypothetical protein
MFRKICHFENALALFNSSTLKELSRLKDSVALLDNSILSKLSHLENLLVDSSDNSLMESVA